MQLAAHVAPSHVDMHAGVVCLRLLQRLLWPALRIYCLLLLQCMGLCVPPPPTTPLPRVPTPPLVQFHMVPWPALRVACICLKAEGPYRHVERGQGL